MTLKPGFRSLKVIENDTIRSGIHDFLLTFHSNHRPISHRFRDIEIANFHTPVYLAYSPREGVTLRIGYRRRGQGKLELWGYQMVVKNFKIGLAVLTQYRRVTHTDKPASQP